MVDFSSLPTEQQNLVREAIQLRAERGRSVPGYVYRQLTPEAKQALEQGYKSQDFLASKYGEPFIAYKNYGINTQSQPKVVEQQKYMSIPNLPSQIRPVEQVRSMSIPAQRLQLQEQPLAVVKTPTFIERYREAIRDKNPVTATVSFALQEAKSPLIKLEQKYTPRGQSLFGGETGEKVQKGAEIGLYVNPYTGPALLIASSAGQFTPGGQKEVKSTSQAISSKTGIPQSIASGGLNILGLSAGFIGARGAVSQIGKAAGYPKYNTIFFSEQLGKTELGEATQIASKTRAITSQENLLSRRQFLSSALTKTEVASGFGDIQRFKSGTIGRVTENEGFLFGKSVFSKPTEFAGVSSGATKQTEFNLLLSRNPEVRKKVEGNIIKSAGIFQEKGKPSSMFASLGGSFNINEERAVFIGKSFPVTKTEQGFKVLNKNENKLFGIIKRTPETIESASSGETIVIKRGISPESLSQQQTKQAVESVLKQRTEIAETKNLFFSQGSSGIKQIIKETTQKTLPSATKQVQESKQSSTSIYAGTGQYEKTNEVAGLSFGFVTPEASILKEQYLLLQPQKEELKQVDINLSRTQERQKQIQLIRTNQRTLQKQKMQQKQANAEAYSFISQTPRIKTPIIIPPFSKNGKNYLASALGKLSKSYNVFVKRKGKNILVGKGLPIGLATKKGVEVTTSTLARSFKLKESGETRLKDIDFKIPARFFRPSKREAGRIVQKAKYSLSARSEVKEIQLAKRSKIKPRRLKLWT